MQKGIHSLRKKKVAISDEEALALQAAILLPDINHGPFSHATENIITQNIHHENISIEIDPNIHNRKYLETKRDRMGHDILK